MRTSATRVEVVAALYAAGPWLRTVAAMVVLAAACLFFADVSAAKQTPPAQALPADQAKVLRDTWGIEILGVRWSAAGYMLDFRFRVKDVEKAKPLLDRTIHAHVEVEKSGARLGVPNPPTTGRLRASAKFPKPNRNYFIFFGNPSRHVKPGDKVTVVIGDFRAEHLTVQ